MRLYITVLPYYGMQHNKHDEDGISMIEQLMVHV